VQEGLGPVEYRVEPFLRFVALVVQAEKACVLCLIAAIMGHPCPLAVGTCGRRQWKATFNLF